MRKYLLDKIKRYSIFFLVISVLLGVYLLFSHIDSKIVVEMVGAENVYLVIFLIAAVGGVSTFGSTAFFTTMLAFSAGGEASPLLLGLAGGFGIFLSDSIFFHLALYGRKSIPKEWKTKVNAFATKARKTSDWIVLPSVYAYLGLSPLPNDLLMVVLVLAKYTYLRIAPVLLLASITLATLTAYAGNFWASAF